MPLQPIAYREPDPKQVQHVTLVGRKGPLEEKADISYVQKDWKALHRFLVLVSGDGVQIDVNQRDPIAQPVEVRDLGGES